MKKSVIILFLFNSYFLFSQTYKDSILLVKDIQEVIISATKTPQAIDKLPLPVKIISKKEIQDYGATRLNEVLTKQTGIISVSTKIGTEGLQMQGLDASYITILIDGLPIIGRSFGAIDLNRISLLDIERIEIIKGASSSLYGSNSLGGVVNLITKKSIHEGKILQGDIKYRSHNTFNPSLIYKIKKESLEISNSIDYYKTDGYDLIDSDLVKTVNPYFNSTFRTRVRYNLSERISLNINGHYYNQEQINIAEHSSSLLKGESSINEWSFGASAKYRITPNFSQQAEMYKTNYKADEFLNTEDGILYEDNYFEHTLLQSEIKSYFRYKRINSIIGVGKIKEKLSRRDFLNHPEQDLNFAYAQIDGTVFHKFNIIIGSRYDNYTAYHPVISNKLAIGFPLTKKIDINTSIGTGFKTPDFRQKYFDFTNSTIGYIVFGRQVAFDRLELMQQEGIIQEIFIPFSELLTPLDSETSVNINLGLKYNLTKKVFFDLNIFNNKVKNLIEAQLVANTTSLSPVFSYFNLNKVETKGVEISIIYKENSRWKIEFGYQLLYAYDTEVIKAIEREELYVRHPQTLESIKLNKADYFGLFNRSRHMGNITFKYFLKNKTDLKITFNGRSKYGLSDSNGNNILDKYDEFVKPYILCDIGATHFINSEYSLQFGVKNIFNFTNPENITNISGRHYYTALTFNFKN